MAAVSIRGLDERVKEKLRVRAAEHGHSMEAEIRCILTDAVAEPNASEELFGSLLSRFQALGGVDLDVPERNEPARAATFEP